jgi:hypothetical protein
MATLDAPHAAADVTAIMDVSRPPMPEGRAGSRAGGTLLLAATLWVGGMAALIQAIWAPFSRLLG